VLLNRWELLQQIKCVKLQCNKHVTCCCGWLCVGIVGMHVTLRVLTPTCHDGIIVFVTGDCPELGNWSPQAAVPMTLVSSTDSGDVWSSTVNVSAARVEYRYFTACVLQSFSSASTHLAEVKECCGCIVAVQNWESDNKPRIMELTGATVDCDRDVYGVRDGVRSVSRGWLDGQSEICLRMHGQALWLRNEAGSETRYCIKCEPVDMRPAMLCSKHLRFSPVYVTDFAGSGFSHQAVSGISFNGSNDHVTFKVQSCGLELVAFKFLLYCNDDDSNCSKMNEIGVAFYQVGTSSQPDVSIIPVTSSKQQIVGTLRVNAVVVNPIQKFPKDLNFSPQCYDKPQQSLKIGHRGLGKSYNKGVRSARVPENTVLSFSETAKCGADMVEFDVILTSDNVPVIFHDFMASVNLRSSDGKRAHALKVPVTDLTIEELNTLNITKWQDSMAVNEDERPFPTLRHCFEALDPRLKFNIEIKYCMHLLSTGQLEEGVQHFPERNSYVDVILGDIFQHAGDREILLSCFDPDVCIMLHAKQTRYPVAFLSQGETGKYETFQDSRAASLQMAVNFAKVESLTGVVLHTEGLLKDVGLIDLAHSYGLSVFCWGEENNDVSTIKLLKKHMLDGIICDRVDELIQAFHTDQQQ